MRKFLTIFLSILLISCLSETSVDPGSSGTFVRYYSGGNNDEAKALEEAPDGGFAILATTLIKKAEADIPKTKIKFIITDNKGNPIGKTSLYPYFQYNAAGIDTSKNYQASSIKSIKDTNGAIVGYVIAGEDIQSDGTIKSLLITTDLTGVVTREESYNYGKGKAVAVTSTGNYLMLTIASSNNMYLLEIDKTTFIPVTATPYPAGQTSIANKLILDESGKAIWSGVVTNSGLTGIRVLKTISSNINTEFDRLVSQPGFDLVGTDICKYGLNSTSETGQYAVIGSTNRKPGATSKSADTDILFVRMNTFGDTLSTKSFPFVNDNQNDVGNAISSTFDGGLILLASVSSIAINGRGDSDFYLIRIDAFGDTVWTNSFGSKFKDEGVAVRQSADGSYVVLGTTTQGSLKILTLLKTDTNGKIE